MRSRSLSSSASSQTLLLISTIFLALHQTTALVIRPLRPLRPLTNVQTSTQTIGKVIETAIDHVHHLPFSSANQSALVEVVLDNETPVPWFQPQRRSANISDFHKIYLSFVLGNRPPWIADRYNVANKYPQHWDQWEYPDLSKKGLALSGAPLALPSSSYSKVKGVPWGLVQAKMPVEEADRLLKAAGFRGGYTQVTMFKWPAEGLLEWLFWGLDLEGNGYGNIVTVDVMTGEVKV